MNWPKNLDSGLNDKNVLDWLQAQGVKIMKIVPQHWELFMAGETQQLVFLDLSQVPFGWKGGKPMETNKPYTMQLS